MKMVMAIAPEERREALRKMLTAHGVHAYSELTGVTGEGAAGRHFGTLTWPGRSVLVFAVVADEKVGEISAAMKDFVSGFYPGEGARAFVIPVESAI